MALSVPLQHTTWDRTLPNPAALLLNGAEPRRSSSLLQHQISSPQFMTPAADDTARRTTVSQVAPPTHSEKEQVPVEGAYPRQRQGSAMSDDSMTDISSEDTAPTENTSSYCLCVPEPKIPRPRNAFILYRQHQHTGVVAQHPGLPNPDVSKIIGEQWRQLSPKTKNEWKALAEQEKARHSQQFPDYRYRPRRNGKYQSVDGTQASGNHPTNCSKCGGKTMNPPHTPHYPVYEHAAVTPITGPPRGQKRAYAEAHGPLPTRQPALVQVPPSAYPTPTYHAWQPRRESVQFVTQPPPPQQRLIVEDPEAKRRRLDASYPMRPVYEQQYYDRDRPAYHRESIARPMPPPPLHRPSHPGPPAAPPRTSQAIQRRDPSLTLPPLKTGAQTKIMTSPAQPSKPDTEGAIWTYPLLTKLKTLSSITPPLATQGSKSSPYEVRGITIAVEGTDHHRVDDMAASISDQLEKEGKFHVRIFSGPNLPKLADWSRRASVEGTGQTLSHAKYLGFMSEWHKLNEEIVDFVTHRPRRMIEPAEQDHEMDDGQSDRVVDSPKGERQLVDMGPYERSSAMRSPISAISPGTVIQTSELSLDTPISKATASNQLSDSNQWPPASSSSSARVTRSSRIPQAAFQTQGLSQTSPQDHQNTHQSPPPPPLPSTRPTTPQSPPPPPSDPQMQTLDLIPVAIIPHYQLTTVDTCSIAIPITDNYDSLTHWRWHATLWRGCAGPDISVVIQGCGEEEGESQGMENGGGNTSNPSRGSLAHSHSHQSIPPGPSGHPHATPHNHPSKPPGSLLPSHQPTSNPPNPTTNSNTNPSQSTPVPAPAPAPIPFSVDVRLQDYRAVIVKTGPNSRGTSLSSGRSVQVNENDSGSNGTTGSRSEETEEREKEKEKENENWEKAKRRVGFEVEEWMRR